MKDQTKLAVFANFLGITYLTLLICMLLTTHQVDISPHLGSLTVVLCWLRMFSVFTDSEPSSVALGPLGASLAEHIRTPEADIVQNVYVFKVLMTWTSLLLFCFFVFSSFSFCFCLKSLSWQQAVTASIKLLSKRQRFLGRIIWWCVSYLLFGRVKFNSNGVEAAFSICPFIWDLQTCLESWGLSIQPWFLLSAFTQLWVK